jgi:cytochrome P450
MALVSELTVLERYDDVVEGLRSRDLRQALYDAGHALMTGVIVNLHGDEHRDRRRLENRLFRRDVFLAWEKELIEPTMRSVLAIQVANGAVDLLPLARRSMMTLSRRVAGIDLADDDEEEFAIFYEQMNRLATASTVIHSTRPKADVVADGARALAEFEERFLIPSMERRQALIARFDAGTIGEEELPRDVLTLLLRNQDRLDLPYEVLRREVAYFPWVGSHSISMAFLFVMHEIFGWLDRHPADLERTTDRWWLVKCTHEALRLHPASPEARRHALADVQLSSGRLVPAGADVSLRLADANRDRAVFGADADEFVPGRPLPTGVNPWGLSFGTGMHACMGQELAGGLPDEGDSFEEGHLFGAIVAMARCLFERKARPDPARPPQPDPNTSRPNFGAYWVLVDD